MTAFDQHTDSDCTDEVTDVLTYSVVVEPDDFEVGERLEVSERVEGSITQVNLNQILRILLVLDWENGPRIADFGIEGHHVG